MYANDIKELKKEGLTHREIGNKLGLTKKEVEDFIDREHKKERKIKAGEAIHKKGRPCKKEGELPPSIKRLEMENELMRDFLSLTERK